jgi:hypothetical protein
MPARHEGRGCPRSSTEPLVSTVWARLSTPRRRRAINPLRLGGLLLHPRWGGDVRPKFPPISGSNDLEPGLIHAFQGVESRSRGRESGAKCVEFRRRMVRFRPSNGREGGRSGVKLPWVGLKTPPPRVRRNNVASGFASPIDSRGWERDGSDGLPAGPLAMRSRRPRIAAASGNLGPYRRSSPPNPHLAAGQAPRRTSLPGGWPHRKGCPRVPRQVPCRPNGTSDRLLI